MLEVLIGVGGLVVGCGVGWYRGRASWAEVEEELDATHRHRLALCSALGEADKRHDRVADAYATTQQKIADIRDLIADTTRVRSSRIREVLGE